MEDYKTVLEGKCPFGGDRIGGILLRILRRQVHHLDQRPGLGTNAHAAEGRM